MDYAPLLYESYATSDVLWVEAVEAPPPPPPELPLWQIALAASAVAIGLVIVTPKK